MTGDKISHLTACRIPIFSGILTGRQGCRDGGVLAFFNDKRHGNPHFFSSDSAG